MWSVYYIMARTSVGKYINRYKKCEMIESVATTSVLGCLNNVCLLIKLHG